MHDPARYGDSFADVYDDWYGRPPDTAAAVDTLVGLAGAGPVLELGVGTGRLALPLAARGLTVVGLDASQAMLDRLSAKLAAGPEDDPASGPTGGAVHPVLGDMADLRRALGGPDGTEPPGPFRLVYVACNTFFNLDRDDLQRRCLRQVAEVLEPDGTLVLEAFVPADPAEVPPTSLEVRTVTLDGVVLTATSHDPVDQVVTGQHVELTADGVRLRPWRVRYLDPDQLDERAADAGLVLAERWDGWDRRPFGDASTTHVSSYRLAGSR